MTELDVSWQDLTELPPLPASLTRLLFLACATIKHVVACGITRRCPTHPMDLASENGHIAVLDWWLTNAPELHWSEESMDKASKHGHVAVLDWWASSKVVRPCVVRCKKKWTSCCTELVASQWSSGWRTNELIVVSHHHMACMSNTHAHEIPHQIQITP